MLHESMVSAISEISGRIIDLLSKTKPDFACVFDDYIDPTYLALSFFHVNYMEVLSAARTEIESREFSNEVGESECVAQAIDKVWEGRKQWELERDIFRQKISAMLAICDDEDFKKFVIASCEYFVVDEGKRHSSVQEFIGGSYLEKVEDLFKDRGGISYYDTPTTTFLNRVRGDGSADNAAEVLRRIISVQDEKYRNVCACYLLSRRSRGWFSGGKYMAWPRGSDAQGADKSD